MGQNRDETTNRDRSHEHIVDHARYEQNTRNDVGLLAPWREENLPWSAEQMPWRAGSLPWKRRSR